jgi:hypothetical protein
MTDYEVLEFDAANRVTAVVKGTRRSEFFYDGMGRRVRMVEREGATVMSDKHQTDSLSDPLMPSSLVPTPERLRQIANANAALGTAGAVVVIIILLWVAVAL